MVKEVMHREPVRFKGLNKTGRGLDSYGWRYYKVLDSCERGKGSIKGGKILHKLSDYLKNDITPGAG
jgi:hypothetical protein